MPEVPAPERFTQPLPSLPDTVAETTPANGHHPANGSLLSLAEAPDGAIAPNGIYLGDARDLLPRIQPNSVALSFWSPPYFVGKSYERDLTFEGWSALLETVVRLHFSIIAPGGFLAINIADILCFPDPTMPRIQANTVRRRLSITREQVLDAQLQNPDFNRYQLAALLGCSEQTIDRRLKHNNIRGGKYGTQTRVKLVGGMVEQWASKAGFYFYDRRVWVKDPAWQNSRWHSLSYRAVDEFEYVYVFWKPGITTVDRARLSRKEWRDWGSRGVWDIPSVRANDDHEAKFPLELARRVVRLFSAKGDVVLDCFVGSGTTAVAAALEDRRYIGLELVERTADLARRNILRAAPPLLSLLAAEPSQGLPPHTTQEANGRQSTGDAGSAISQGTVHLRLDTGL